MATSSKNKPSKTANSAVPDAPVPGKNASIAKAEKPAKASKPGKVSGEAKPSKTTKVGKEEKSGGKKSEKATLKAAAEGAVKAIKAAKKAALAPKDASLAEPQERKRLKKKHYEKAIAGLQVELVKLQEWIKFKKLKVVVLFEGRDAAGKGGCIKRITESLSPRVTRVVALPAPTERERTQWYFQRYVQHLPAAGEMVLLDRSWYNRAGVEHVMGFCTPEEYSEFLRSCPEFERMLVRSGIILIKYWFSVSNDEQERRFQKRIYHPTKHWKLSPMDLQSRARWVEYSKAKDEMFAHTDIKQAPWYVVHGDDKERARLNVITHLLSMIDYQDLTPERIELPPRQEDHGYVRPPLSDQTFIPEIY